MSKAKLEKLIAAAYELKEWRDSGGFLQNRDIENKIISALTSDEPPKETKGQYRKWDKKLSQIGSHIKINEHGVILIDNYAVKPEVLVRDFNQIMSRFEQVGTCDKCGQEIKEPLMHMHDFQIALIGYDKTVGEIP